MSIAGTSAITELWAKIKATFASKSDAIKNITRSGTTFTATKADGTTFTFTQQDSDSHHVSNTIVNNSSTATSNTSTALTNGNVYLNHVENGSVRNSHKISGSGTTTVTTDASGNIVISSSGGGVVVSSTAPTGNASVLWVNSSTGVANYYNGTAWTPIKSVWG